MPASDRDRQLPFSFPSQKSPEQNQVESIGSIKTIRTRQHMQAQRAPGIDNTYPGGVAPIKPMQLWMISTNAKRAKT
jgi:hypothetical protein